MRCTEGVTEAENPIIRAARFAERAHEGQSRWFTGEPYVRHPCRVAARVLLIPGATEAMVLAALLHDVVEDTPVELEEIRAEFGDEVARLVDELSDEFTKEAHPRLNRAERRRLEIERLSAVSPEAKTVKLCDVFDNLRDMDPADGFARVFLRESRVMLETLGPEAEPGVRQDCSFEVERLEKRIARSRGARSP